jgi:hypothetical protein
METSFQGWETTAEPSLGQFNIENDLTHLEYHRKSYWKSHDK